MRNINNSNIHKIKLTKAKPIKSIQIRADIDQARVYMAVMLLAVVAIFTLLPDFAFAAAKVNTFDTIYDKISGWISGALGKTIVLVSILIASAMGVLGFAFQKVLGVFGVGILIGCATTIVELFFE